jgi:hypothetical protein
MTRDEAQELWVQLLLDKVRQDRYPSTTQLDLIEDSIPAAMIPDYLEVLLSKFSEDTYPSLAMLSRFRRVAQKLPRAEQPAE